jgi:hypothetical protein
MNSGCSEQDTGYEGQGILKHQIKLDGSSGSKTMCAAAFEQIEYGRESGGFEEIQSVCEQV